MTDNVRRFITRLSPEGKQRFFELANVTMPDVSDLKPRERDQKLVQALISSTDSSRGLAEATSTHILLLCDKGDFAEIALRDVCFNKTDLLKILESEKSLEERIFLLWLENETLLDRARNLAMSHHQRDGRFHRGFNVLGNKKLQGNLEKTLGEIKKIVQKQQGGRKVAVDQFNYQDTSSQQIVHHFAVYLERPASKVMTFKDGENEPLPVLRRDARELAIDYSPSSGRLDLAGKGIGGQKAFTNIAQSFANFALSGSELNEIKCKEWNLASFLYESPSNLQPPPGFSEVRVTEIVLYSQQPAGGKVTIRAGNNQTVYEKIRSLGISRNSLLLERVYALTLTLEAPPENLEDPDRIVRTTISNKNAKTFESATLNDRKIIESWLENPPFVEPE